MKLSNYKLIYVACKFGGDKENIKLCEEFIRELNKEDKKNGIVGKIYFSPLNAFGWLYDETEYQEGLNWTLRMLTHCDELYVTPGWEDSRGVNQEIAIATYLGIPIRYI